MVLIVIFFSTLVLAGVWSNTVEEVIEEDSEKKWKCGYLLKKI